MNDVIINSILHNISNESNHLTEPLQGKWRTFNKGKKSCTTERNIGS
jgi:hypothetical protein